jgi:hypothetical protein
MCDPDDPDLVVTAGDSILRDQDTVPGHDHPRGPDPELGKKALDGPGIVGQGTGAFIRENDLHLIPLYLAPGGS